MKNIKNRVLSIKTVLPFSPTDYDVILKNIKESRAFMGYSDYSNNEISQNNRYENYLDAKTNAYFKTHGNQILKEGTVGIRLLNDQDIKATKNFLSEYSIEDENDYDILCSNGVKQLQLKESTSYDISLDYHSIQINVAHDYFNEEFREDNEFMCTLLPFFGKVNDDDIISVVFLRISKEGLMNLDIQIYYNIDSNNKSDLENPREKLVITNAAFYDMIPNYKILDYHKKVKEESIDLENILERYLKLLSKWSDIDFSSSKNDFLTRYVWTILTPDVNKSKYEHKKYIYQLLTNSSKDLMLTLQNQHIKAKVQESNIFSRGVLTSFYCENYGAVLDINKEKLEKKLKDKRLTEKEEVLNISDLSVLFHIIISHFVFYDISLFKEYYIDVKLKELRKSKVNINFKEYNQLKKEFNEFTIRYNEFNVIKWGGSPQKLYEDINEKTLNNERLETIRYYMTEIKDDLQSVYLEGEKLRQLSYLKFEKSLLVLGSILTVILTFDGVKSIVNSVVKVVLSLKEIDRNTDILLLNSDVISLFIWVLLLVIVLMYLMRKK